jgi:hypothetical protein
MKKPVHNLSSYEIFLPQDFDHIKFRKNSEFGVGSFWLICTEDQGDFQRYRGIFFAGSTSLHDWIRILLDVGTDYAYLAVPWHQKLTEEETARQVKQALKGTQMLKDGVEVQ